MNGYLFLVGTILTESLAILCMKMADGITNKGYFVGAVLCYFLSFMMLNWALKYLPMGWTNAMWAGASTFLVALVGVLFFKEKVSLLQGVFMLFILIGLVGLQMTKQTNP